MWWYPKMVRYMYLRKSKMIRILCLIFHRKYWKNETTNSKEVVPVGYYQVCALCGQRFYKSFNNQGLI